ncbi:hypothetical protein [Alkaliphilus metalliredigens]|nr:hypothetical protein [Alkaliphilus metalliredigens]
MEIFKRRGEYFNHYADFTSEEILEFIFIAARGLVYNWCLHDGAYPLEETMSIFIKGFLVSFENHNPSKTKS